LRVEILATYMDALLYKILAWLGIVPSVPSTRRDRHEPGGVADRELDGVPATPFVSPPFPTANLRGEPGRGRSAGIVHKPAATTPGERHDQGTSPAQDYRTWRGLASLLASGRAPEGLTVGHSLSLAKLWIRSLPPGLTVRGDLDLRQCQRLRQLGDGTEVAGDLLIGGRCLDPPWWEDRWLREPRGDRVRTSAPRGLSRDGQCPLAELPSGLSVGGDLRLRNCRRLVRLPDDLRVGRSIALAGCTALDHLPDPFEVRGDLTILSAPGLTSLPTRLIVEGHLRLIGVRIDHLPAGLTVGGDLTLECCPRLANLPEGLTVGGSLIVRRCPIERLPRELRVGGDLRLHRLGSLRELPAGLSAPGRIELVCCPSLTRIATGTRVGTDLIVRRCEGLRELPEGLQVPGTLDLRGCTGLKSLPRGMSLGSDLGQSRFVHALRLADCLALRSLPEDLVLGGPIEVAGSGLRDLPERLYRTVEVLWRGVLVPPRVVFRPQTLTPEEILSQRNAELRRVMLERVGLDRILRMARAEILDSDTDPGGVRRLVRISPRTWSSQARPSCYLHCRCPSTGRDYLLRVPPETRTCREAASWLAGFDDPEAYRPILET
jgi:hypothetical protein